MIMPLQAQILSHRKRHTTHAHAHEGGQLYWLQQGLILITSGQWQWSLTPGTVIWIPPGIPHQATVFGDMSGQHLVFDETHCAKMPTFPCLYAAGPFLQALLSRLGQLNGASLEMPRHERLLAVLRDELGDTPVNTQTLRWPEDRRARAVADTLLTPQGQAMTQSQLALHTGMSVRTLGRLFKQETGLNFIHWRRQARLLKSLEGLAKGDTVSDAAFACGYENVSAYIAAFRVSFGTTPGRVAQRNHGPCDIKPI